MSNRRQLDERALTAHIDNGVLLKDAVMIHKLMLLLVVSALPLIGGCAVVTVAGAAAGAAISVGGAVVSTGVKVTGKVIEKTVDIVAGDDEDDD